MHIMQKILMVFIVCSLIFLASCVNQKDSENTGTWEEVKSFDSPTLLRIGENTSLTEKGLWDE